MSKKLMTAMAVTMLATLGVSKPAKASEWGCQVLLCLGDPRGPEHESECRPPIKKLWRELASRHPEWPTCDMAEGPGGRSYAERGYSWYDGCPTGTVALPEGQYAVKGTKAMMDAYNAASRFQKQRVFANETLAEGIGEGTNVSFMYDGTPGQSKVCVAGHLGNVSMYTSNGYRQSVVSSGVYDQVVLVPPAASPRSIDLYIDNKLYRVVRY